MCTVDTWEISAPRSQVLPNWGHSQDNVKVACTFAYKILPDTLFGWAHASFSSFISNLS